MASILDFVKNEEVLAYARQLNPATYLGLTLFPVEKVSELDYTYIKGSGGTQAPIVADPVAWEASAPMVPHEGVVRVEGELPPIKQKSRFSEQEVIKIFNPRTTSERRYAITKLFDDLTDRVDGVLARANLMALEALTTGKIVFTSEGVKVTADFSHPNGNKKTPNTAWSDTTNADPIADIKAVVDVIAAAGYSVPDNALTSTKVLNYILQNAKVRQAFFGTGETMRPLTAPQLNAFFASIGLPTIRAYDDKYKIVGTNGLVTSARYTAENLFTLWPSDLKLGDMLSGPTAEAIRQIGAEEASGVWAEVFETKDPVNVWTYACATMFPTFPGIDGVGIITAYPA